MNILVIEDCKDDFDKIKSFLPEETEETIDYFTSWDEYDKKRKLSVAKSYDLVVSDILCEPIPTDATLDYDLFKRSLQKIIEKKHDLNCPLIVITKIPRYTLVDFFEQSMCDDSKIGSLFTDNTDELTKQIRRNYGVLAYEPNSSQNVYLTIQTYLTMKSNDRYGKEVVSFDIWRDAMQEIVNCAIKK